MSPEVALLDRPDTCLDVGYKGKTWDGQSGVKPALLTLAV